MITWLHGKLRNSWQLYIAGGCLAVAACLSIFLGTIMSNKPSIISGLVLNPKEQPVADARVYFVDGPVLLPDVAILTNSNGRFSLTAPAAGTYQIGCTVEGFTPTTVTVNVTSGQQDTQVQIRLRR